MLRDELVNLYKGLGSLLERWDGLRQMTCCSQSHRESISGDFFDDVLRQCVHCCPSGTIVSAIPTYVSKTRQWLDTDVYASLPVQEKAQPHCLDQVGYGVVWGYKVALISKLMPLRRRPILESILLVCKTLVQSDVRMLVEDGRPACQAALGVLHPVPVPRQPVRASVGSADEAANRPMPNQSVQKEEVDDDEEEEEEEEEEEAEEKEDDESYTNDFSDEDGHDGACDLDADISDTLLQNVADELEKQGFTSGEGPMDLSAKPRAKILDRVEAEAAAQALRPAPPTREAPVGPTKSASSILKSLAASCDNESAPRQLPLADSLPESVKVDI